MVKQVVEEVEKKLKIVGMEPTSENIKNGVIAQVSGTHYHIISDFSDSSFSNVGFGVRGAGGKDIANLFPAYAELVQSLERLPDNIDDRQKIIINEKIEEISKTITENIIENVAIADKAKAEKIPASEALRKTNLDWIVSNPPELEQYKGKYVAIENGKVVGSGTTSVEAVEEARKDIPNRKVLLKLVSDTDIGL